MSSDANNPSEALPEAEPAEKRPFFGILGLVLIGITAAVLISLKLLGNSPFGWLETFGAITGALCVFLVVLQSIWNFPIGIVSCFLYMIFFFDGKLYGDSGLQILFIVLGLHGWLHWSRKQGQEKPIQRIPLLELTILTILFPAVWMGLVKFLEAVAGAAPLLDAFVTTLSIFSQYLLNRRYIESWLGWIVVDQVAVYLFITREMYLTAGLYALFLAMCIAGYFEWKKHLRTEAAP
jgi:nicotinamide mononucleotide transporter